MGIIFYFSELTKNKVHLEINKGIRVVCSRMECRRLDFLVAAISSFVYWDGYITLDDGTFMNAKLLQIAPAAPDPRGATRSRSNTCCSRWSTKKAEEEKIMRDEWKKIPWQPQEPGTSGNFFSGSNNSFDTLHLQSASGLFSCTETRVERVVHSRTPARRKFGLKRSIRNQHVLGKGGHEINLHPCLGHECFRRSLAPRAAAAGQDHAALAGNRRQFASASAWSHAPKPGLERRIGEHIKSTGARK